MRVAYEQSTAPGDLVISPFRPEETGLQGRDVIGCVRHGTDKNAAFVLPMLEHMRHPGARRREPARPRALVLVPSRELAEQIAENVAACGHGARLRSVVIFDGCAHERQVRELGREVDILIAMPGCLVDFVDQDVLDLSGIEMLVLDEFDRIFDRGFLPAVGRLLRHVPAQRQTLLFSETLPPELEAVAKQLVRDPVRTASNKVASAPEPIDQAVWFVEQSAKRPVLARLLREREISRALVFARTKYGATSVAAHLLSAGIQAEAIHANKARNERDRALERFLRGDLQVLVTTDVAVRDVDIEGITHVINFDLPVEPESYVQRIGRSARGGRSGAALSLCTADERSTLSRIERLTGQPLRVLNANDEVRVLDGEREWISATGARTSERREES